MNLRHLISLGLVSSALALGACTEEGGLAAVGSTSAGPGQGSPGGDTGGGTGGDTGGGTGGDDGGGTNIDPATTEIELLYESPFDGRILQSAIADDASRAVFAMEETFDGTVQIFSIDAETKTRIQITQEAFSSTLGFEDYYGVNSTATHVAFISNQNYTGENPDGDYHFFLATTDGTTVTQLTTQNVVKPGGSVPRGGQVSSDGTVVVFQSAVNLAGLNPNEISQIFAVDGDGGNLRQVTDGTFSGNDLSLSADGSKIAFVSDANPLGNNPDGNSEIFVINTDGSGLAQVTITSVWDNAEPRISNDGSRIAFVSEADPIPLGNGDSSMEVYVANSNGSGITQLTATIGDSGIHSRNDTPEQGRMGAVDIAGDGRSVVFGSTFDHSGLGELDTHSRFWADTAGTTLIQVLRAETIPVGVAQEVDQVSLNGDGTILLIDTEENYTDETTGRKDKLYLLRRR